MGEWFALHTWPTGASFCTHRAGGVAEENWNRMGEWFALGPQRTAAPDWMHWMVSSYKHTVIMSKLARKIILDATFQMSGLHTRA
eukprot:scaffold253129_cov18-Tisochrysis_lutea.AAC.1